MFKYTTLLFLSLALFACDKKNSRAQDEEAQEKYIELGNEVRSFSCTPKIFKECFEEYLDDTLTDDEVSDLKDIFGVYFVYYTEEKLTLDAAVLGMKYELNEQLFNIVFEDKDLRSPDLYKLSRFAELQNIIIQIIEN